MKIDNSPDMSILVSSIEARKKGQKLAKKVSVFLDSGVEISTEAFELVDTLPSVSEAKQGVFYILPDESLNYIAGDKWNTISGKTEARIVEELPTTGEVGYIYLVLKESSSEGNIYDEYIWVMKADETYGWEHLGATNEVSINTLTDEEWDALWEGDES